MPDLGIGEAALAAALFGGGEAAAGVGAAEGAAALGGAEAAGGGGIMEMLAGLFGGGEAAGAEMGFAGAEGLGGLSGLGEGALPELAGLGEGGAMPFAGEAAGGSGTIESAFGGIKAADPLNPMNWLGFEAESVGGTPAVGGTFAQPAQQAFAPSLGEFGMDPGAIGAGSGGASPTASAFTPSLGNMPVAEAFGSPGTMAAQSGGAPAGGESGNFLTELLGGAKKSVSGNPLGIAMAGGGLASMLFNNKSGQSAEQLRAEMSGLTGQATELGQNGKYLMSYLQQGTLPPGLAKMVSDQTASEKARLVSNASARGMSADPKMNSALMADLAAADRRAIEATAKIGEQLMDSGIKASGLSSNIMMQLAKINQTMSHEEDENMRKAIASFAGALGGAGTKAGALLK